MLLLKSPDDGWSGDAVAYEPMMQSLMGTSWQFYPVTSNAELIRFDRCKRRSLPLYVQRRLRFAEVYSTDAALFSVRMTCDGCRDDDEDLAEHHIRMGISDLRSAMDVERWVHDLTLAANLAAPGSLLLVDGVIRHGRTVLHTFDAEGNYNNFLGRLSRGAWPPYLALDLQQCWRWLRGNDGFIRRFGGGAVGRALNALTHIAVSQHDEAVELMWAMVGLEALFCRDRRNPVKQIRLGLHRLVGQAGHGDVIRLMYDIRSRFVHGSLDFVGEHPLRDAADSYMEEDDEALRVAADTAKAALLVSIQHMIRNDWGEKSLQRELASVVELRLAW